MAGDYTRFTHRPEKRYSGVLMQQGRVQLDSDSNEQVEILKRRLEVQAFDTFCGCAVPDTTPDGFKATVVTQGTQHDLTLGTGRMYVEGQLVEIFEGEAWTYLNQPFLPNPPTLEPVAGAVPLVYLDVWDREVTWVQDRDLLEKALQGPDTATRIQTVWQVKIAVGACDTDLNSLFPPSAGRLSSRAVVPPVGDDPCIVSPTGGYRGLENRLYRVEVHDPGQAGNLSSARFKWSRDNASVVSPIESLDASREVLTVTRIGRDPVLRFKVGDWVELLDDHRELHGESGQMAQVLAVDEANRSVTLDRGAAADFDPGDPDRHTRLILWSQNAKNSSIDGDGLIAASSSWIVLEDGVEIQLTLDPAAGGFHVGDYWAFAARTVDGSVEELVEASPRGIIHHYCSLAELGTTAGAGLRVREDCRRIHQCGDQNEPIEPGDGAGCCVVVDPGESIQAAIDGLPAAGGCVCLKAGTHPIEAPIRIDRSEVVLHGESLGARVVRSNGIRALSIEPVSDVAVRDLRFEVSGPSEEGAEIVSLLECSGVAIEGCQFLAMDATGAPAPAIGISVVGSTSVDIRDNVMESLTAGVVGQDSFWIQIIDNHMTGLQSQDPSIVGLVGAASGDSADGPWRIESNRIENFRTGVEIGAEATGSRVEGNAVQVATGQPEGGQVFAIDNAAIDTVIRCNTVEISDSGHGGIRTTAPATRIEGNSVISRTGAGDIGILVGGFEPDGSPPADDCTIRDNSVQGLASAIATIGSLGDLPAEGICILENRIEPSASGDSGSAIFLLETRGAVVANNRTRGGSDGIAAQDSSELTVRGNTLEALSRYALFATTLAGTALIVDNSFSGTGPSSLAEVSGPSLEKITFSSNVCDHSLDGESPATIVLEGSHQIVVGNHVQALSPTLPSFDFNNPEPLAVMSNLTTGELKSTGSPVPVNFTDFNARV